MSGIAGIFHLDGRPVDRPTLQRMTDSIAHRGRDGAGNWVNGSVGFGHRMFCTTPESLHEAQPLSDEHNNLCLTMDGRIDNRDELKVHLLARGFRLRSDTDAELVLRAYECWGEDCAARLLGDFAFAIWDERRRQLFCARDVVGLRPFYYYADSQVFLFASELQALFELADVPGRPNEGMIGEYLAVAISNRAETLFESIKRLPPAHCLSVRQNRIQLRRYWDIEPARQVCYRSDEEYAEHFLHLFRDAVTCRLRVHGNVAADLSGGLDSSSIVSLSQSLMQSGSIEACGFEAYSLVFPGKWYDESEYIRAVVEKWRVRSTLVPPSPMASERFTEHARRSQDFPGYPNGSIVSSMPTLARSKACRVNLLGVGGDDVFVRKRDHYSVSLRQRKYLKAWRDLRMALEGGEVGLIPPPGLYLRAAYRLAAKLWRVKKDNPQSTDLPNWIEPAFAKRIQLADRLRQKVFELEFADAEQEFLYKCIFDPWLLHSIELEERASTFYGLEQRQPFRDRRIIEFCCAIPPEQRERNYLTRFALRGAMRGILPEKIRRRRTKGSFDHLFAEAMQLVGGLRRFRTLKIAELGWVNADKVRDMYQSTGQMLNNSQQFIWPLWMVFGIELWNESLRRRV